MTKLRHCHPICSVENDMINYSALAMHALAPLMLIAARCEQCRLVPETIAEYMQSSMQVPAINHHRYRHR